MNLKQKAKVHAALGDPIRLGLVAELELGDKTFQELAAAASVTGNLVAHHLDVLQQAGLIERTVSEGDRRRRYISLNPAPLGELVTVRTLRARSVLFVCTHNSARSQYAAASWRRRTDQVADSAGTHPADRIHPRAVQVAMENGVDLADCQPKGYESLKATFDLVVSVCDRAREFGSPLVRPNLHWSVADPVKVGTLKAFRVAFADLDRRIDRLSISTRAGS
jgi:protein-tyrosine-phosphatase